MHGSYEATELALGNKKRIRIGTVPIMVLLEWIERFVIAEVSHMPESLHSGIRRELEFAWVPINVASGMEEEAKLMCAKALYDSMNEQYNLLKAATQVKEGLVLPYFWLFFCHNLGSHGPSDGRGLMHEVQLSSIPRYGQHNCGTVLIQLVWTGRLGLTTFVSRASLLHVVIGFNMELLFPNYAEENRIVRAVKD
ncbi:hypothetical protein Cgig2_032655 [Carnegiea gigantea]|uniref:Uncharacterized protein n=1 Tax=Carnegiea gigantea TaxID=171969 RepID=A0A9Q1GG46_9CARY|nr:hypothetical protein Cgig2_032655 [Carnegiea gigantea]